MFLLQKTHLRSFFHIPMRPSPGLRCFASDKVPLWIFLGELLWDTGTLCWYGQHCGAWKAHMYPLPAQVVLDQRLSGWEYEHPAAPMPDRAAVKLYLAFWFVELCLNFLLAWLALSFLTLRFLARLLWNLAVSFTFASGASPRTPPKTSHFQYGTHVWSSSPGLLMWSVWKLIQWEKSSTYNV